MFISFEGGDGAGKSTQIHELTEYLRQMGYEVVLTREPGGTPISEAVRGILLDPQNKAMDAVTETLLYAAARAQLVAEVIRPAVNAGRIVICDRFLDSSIAYQAFGRDLGDMVGEINRYGVGDCMPDLTIYLRVDPKAGKARIQGRAADRIESEPDAFHQKVFEGDEEICRRDPARVCAVDAGRGIEEIAEEIRAEVMKRIHEI